MSTVELGTIVIPDDVAGFLKACGDEGIVAIGQLYGSKGFFRRRNQSSHETSTILLPMPRVGGYSTGTFTFLGVDSGDWDSMRVRVPSLGVGFTGRLDETLYTRKGARVIVTVRVDWS